MYTEFDVNPMRKKQSPIRIQLLHKADWEGFRQFASGLLFKLQSLGDSASVEDMWLLFKSKIQEGVNKCPIQEVQDQRIMPVGKKQLQRKIRRRDKAFKRSKRTG